MSTDLPTTPTSGAPTEAPAKALPHRAITALTDVDTVEINVEVEDNGEILTFPMRLLSHFEWMDIGLQVPHPKPPVMGADKQGRPIFDFNDAGHKANVDRAELERNYRRLAASLKIDIPGSTLAEQAEVLKTRLSFNVCRQLIGAMVGKAAEGMWHVAERASTFHGNGTGDTARAGAVGTGDGTGVEPTE